MVGLLFADIYARFSRPSSRDDDSCLVVVHEILSFVFVRHFGHCVACEPREALCVTPQKKSIVQTYTYCSFLVSRRIKKRGFSRATWSVRRCAHGNDYRTIPTSTYLTLCALRLIVEPTK